jgi:hypothetical protein
MVDDCLPDVLGSSSSISSLVACLVDRHNSACKTETQLSRQLWEIGLLQSNAPIQGVECTHSAHIFSHPLTSLPCSFGQALSNVATGPNSHKAASIHPQLRIAQTLTRGVCVHSHLLVRRLSKGSGAQFTELLKSTMHNGRKLRFR